MNCFIIASLSADGFIGMDASHSSFDWNSAEDKKRFVELTKRAGVIVVGSTTFATFKKPLKDRLNIIYSHSQSFEGAEVTQKEPAELLKDLEGRGFTEVAICGGAHIYSMFIKAGVVDTLYLTIEPIVFGGGIKLFSEAFTAKLKLENSVTTEDGTLLLEYSVRQ